MAKGIQFRGTLYLTLSAFVFMVSGYLVNVLLARYLGPETYGKYGVLIALVTVFNLIQTAGLPQALSKFVAQDQAKQVAYLGAAKIIQLATTLGASLVLAVFAGPLAALLGDASLAPYLRILSLVFPVYGFFALFGGYYNGLHAFDMQALLNGIYSVAKVLSVVLLALKFGLAGAIAGFVLSPLLALPIGYKFSAHFRDLPFRKLWLFSLPLVVFALLSTLHLNADLFAFKRLAGSDAEVGYYVVAQSIASILFFGLNAASTVIFPSVARLLGQGNKAEVAAVIRSTFKYMWLIVLPLAVLISAQSTAVIALLFSKQYVPGAEALSILILGYAALTLFAVLASALNGLGKGKVSAVLAGLGIVVDIAVCMWLVPSMGLVGAAIGSLISGLIIVILALGILNREYGVLPGLRTVLVSSVAASAVYLVARQIPAHSLLVPLVFVMGIAFYVMILVAAGEVSASDLKNLARLKRKRSA